MRRLVTVFLSVFIAELGDKTQVATLLFASDPNINRLGVFLASSFALALSSLIAVLIGAELSRVISAVTVKIIAGIGFMIIGVWILATSRS
jgi:putative Ca2+/H+ antiporter (TMEM165/GDT1 family)